MNRRKPNVVLFISDSQRWDTLHCGGNEKIATPHLDFLAKEGVLFTNAYCSSPLWVTPVAMSANGTLGRRGAARVSPISQ